MRSSRTNTGEDIGATMSDSTVTLMPSIVASHDGTSSGAAIVTVL
jgi:hypothetical protein